MTPSWFPFLQRKRERKKERWRRKENKGKRVLEEERNQETNMRNARK
jgi:hypothetical protein